MREMLRTKDLHMGVDVELTRCYILVLVRHLVRLLLHCHLSNLKGDSYPYPATNRGNQAYDENIFAGTNDQRELR